MNLLALLFVLLTGLSATGLAIYALAALERGAAAYGSVYTTRTSRAFEDLFLFVPPRRIAEISWIAAGIVAFLLFLVLGGVAGSGVAVMVRLAVALAGGSAMLAAPSQLLKFLRLRRRERIEKQLVDTLSDMSNALRSGFSIQQAIEHIVENGQAPISEEFATMLHQTRVGVPFEDALRNLDARVGSDDLSLMVLSIETARRSGGNLAEIFETISKTIRERLRIRERIHTLTAQGRMQGLVLSLMPPVVGVAIYFVQPDMFNTFLHAPAGLGCIAAIVVLLVLGALSIRKIVNIDI